MKIIHLISGGDTGGAKTHVLTLLQGLSREIEICLVCFMRGEFSREAEEMGIPTVVLEDGVFDTVSRLRRMIKNGGYDIMHSHGSRGNFFSSILKSLTGLPTVSTIHSDYRLDYMGRPLAAVTYGGLNAMALRCMDYLIGVSDPMRSLLISRGFRPGRVFSIYNGVDFSRPAPAVDRRAYFAQFGFELPENAVVVGIAARLDPVKDIATLLRGFAIARARHSGLRLVIAGNGRARENLEKLASELSIESDVCFTGWLSDVDAFNECLDINALTSFSETFPYALTEGARAHLATVASRVGGIPALIIDGETGLLFEAGDAEALGECLSRLAGDGELRRRLGEALYDKAKGEFSLEATRVRQLEIYSAIRKREAAKRRGEREGVVLCGAYGYNNAGDDAILEAILRALRGVGRDMPVTVMCRRPRETAERFGVDTVYTLNVPAFRKRMRRAKLYINGGGSLIQDVTSRRSLFFYLYTLSAAKRLGCRVIMYGCGIGPVNYPADRRAAARVIDRYVDTITLREDNSLAELQGMGVSVPEIILASDPALTAPAASSSEVMALLRRSGIDPAGKYFCFALRKWPGFAEKAPAFAAAAEYCYEKYGLTPLFLSVNPGEDGDASAGVTSLLKNTPAHILDETLGSALAIGVISHMTAVVSMRLHGLIFAAGQGVPLVGVSYDPKVTAFLKYIGQERCVALDELTPELLCDLCGDAVALSGEGSRLAAAAAALAEIEHRNIDAARRLLEE